MTLKNTMTIKRPDGQIEVLDITERFPQGLTAERFRQIITATSAAGRGMPLAYNNAKADADRANAKREIACANRKRRAFDALYNEGGEGYNPYR